MNVKLPTTNKQLANNMLSIWQNNYHIALQSLVQSRKEGEPVTALPRIARILADAGTQEWHDKIQGLVVEGELFAIEPFIQIIEEPNLQAQPKPQQPAADVPSEKDPA